MTTTKIVIFIAVLFLLGGLVYLAKEQRAESIQTIKSTGNVNSKAVEDCNNGVCPIPKEPGSKVTKAKVTMVNCQVCSSYGTPMKIDIKKAAGKSVYKGKTYYFCSSACKTAFDKDPGKYIK